MKLITQNELKEKMKNCVFKHLDKLEERISLFRQYKDLLCILTSENIINSYNNDFAIENIIFENIKTDFYKHFFININSKDILNKNMINVELMQLVEKGIKTINDIFIITKNSIEFKITCINDIDVYMPIIKTYFNLDCYSPKEIGIYTYNNLIIDVFEDKVIIKEI